MLIHYVVYKLLIYIYDDCTNYRRKSDFKFMKEFVIKVNLMEVKYSVYINL